jgi:hypothetical protein
MRLEFNYNPNRNGRVYERRDFDKAIKAYVEKIKNGTAYGELDQPESGIVSLKNVSHIIEDIRPLYKRIPRKKKKKMKKRGTWDDWKNKQDLKVKIRLLDTPSGNIAKDIINSMGSNSIGIGMRGTGVVNSDGTIENPTIHSWDIINKHKDD